MCLVNELRQNTQSDKQINVAVPVFWDTAIPISIVVHSVIVDIAIMPEE